jgi:hypothetical protein
VNVKEIKCFFAMVAEHESMFAIVGFLAWQILGIVESQIETKRIFSLVGILTNLKRYKLQSKNLKNLIFVNKNWPSDPRIGSKSLSSLIEFIDMDRNLEKELEEFESPF